MLLVVMTKQMMMEMVREAKAKKDYRKVREGAHFFACCVEYGKSV